MFWNQRKSGVKKALLICGGFLLLCLVMSATEYLIRAYHYPHMSDASISGSGFLLPDTPSAEAIPVQAEFQAEQGHYLFDPDLDFVQGSIRINGTYLPEHDEYLEDFYTLLCHVSDYSSMTRTTPSGSYILVLVQEPNAVICSVYLSPDSGELVLPSEGQEYFLVFPSETPEAARELLLETAEQYPRLSEWLKEHG